MTRAELGSQLASSATSTRRPSSTTIAWSMPDVSIARRIVKCSMNAIGSAQQGQLSMVACVTGQADQDGRPVVQRTGALRPFDQGHRIRCRLVEPGIDPGEPLQSIKIVVLDRQPTLVLLVEDEGRTVDAGGHTQGLRDAFDQFRLPRSKVAFETDHIACPERPPQSAAQAPALL